MPSEQTREDVTRHIEFKTMMRELDAAVAERMLAALAAGAEPDYAKLQHAATFIDPPRYCFHTADRAMRDAIATEGLRPGNGTQNWGDKAAGQPTGVYVAPQPDTHGMWSHAPEFDVWQVDVEGLNFQHDRLNPGCFILPAVPADRLSLYDPPTDKDR
jgi:hypothetical protein